jgi:O-antigen/teichoic acid export membrane protein
VHWRIILRNIFSNWAGYLVTALIGFFLSPFIVHSLGTTGYGIWTLVLSLTGYFGLLDLGIRSSVGRFVARYLALKDDQSSNRILSTAFAILGCGGMLTLIATLVAVRFFFGSFHVEPQYAAAAKTALIITGITMSCALPLGTFSSLLVAMERFDILSGVTIISELTRAGLIVFCLRSGHGLVAVALIALAMSIAQYSTMAIFAKLLHRPLRLSIRFVDRPAFRELFGFGIYRFIWIVANQLIFYSDSVVIGFFLGPGAITYYAIAGTLINYGRTFVSLVTDTFYPAATRLDAKRDLDGLRELLILGTKVALLVSLPLCIGFVFLGKQFIVLWMGNAYASSALFLTVLTIPQFVGLSQYVSALVLAGMARHRVLAYLVFAEGFANLVLSVILVQRIGLVGVAWGTVIPDLICTGVIIPAYTLRTLNLGVREYVGRAWVRPVLGAVPIAGLAYAFSRLVETPSWPLFGCEVAAICVVFATLSYFLCLTPGQRAMVAAKLFGIFQRQAIPVQEA